MPISYQVQSPVVGLVLPSNSPGVHTLWLPIIPLQIGLVLKPGPQEPWTPYRMAEAFFQAGIPREAISIYPGGADVGAAVLDSCGRTPDLRRHRRRSIAIAAIREVQAHGPGFSKILIGDDLVDRLGAVSRRDGRQRVPQQRPRLHQLLGHLGQPPHARDRRRARAAARRGRGRCRPTIPTRALAAFTVPGVAEAISQSIDADLQAPGVTDVTATYRDGEPRLVKQGRADYLLPTVLHCESPDAAGGEEGIHVPVRHRRRVPRGPRCSTAIGPTLVCSAITGNAELRRRLLDAVHIDRLNLGPVPTTQLNWLQPHEGNLIDFLFRARAFQMAEV